MAKKRRKPSRPRNRHQQGAGTVDRTSPGGSETATGRPGTTRAVARSQRPAPTSAASQRSRAEKKELARAEREAVRKQIARAERTRRLLIAVVVAAVVGVGAFLIFNVSSPGDVSAQALDVAQAAGCGDPETGDVVTPASEAPGGQHLASGESADYAEQPATSGFHDPQPLPPEPAVYTQPVREENAVHNLEHGYVLLYYRAEDPEALAEDVVARLAAIAEQQDKVLLAPYPDLDEGTSFAIVAWNKVWECPVAVSAVDVATMANAFIEAYRGTSNAPEGNAP